MGIRISLGLCYGFQTTKEERKLLNPTTVEKAYIPYFKEMYDRYEKRNFDDDLGDDGDIHDLLECMSLWHAINSQNRIKINEIKSERERIEVLNDRLFDLMVNWILYPDQEIGSDTFFGYVAEAHYSDLMNYALALVLKPDLEEYENLEIELPPTNMTIKSEKVENDQGVETIVPYRNLLYDRVFLKALKRREVEGNKLAFDSEKDADTFVDTFYKTHSYGGLHFDKGLELVRVMFPEKTMDDINRYIVGWWS